MSERMLANATWYTFRGRGGNFSVYSFTGEEAVNKPYTFSIELVSRSANEDIHSLLGTEALLTIPDRSGESRYVHGLICDFAQGHTANTFTHYRCTLVPRLWFLDKIRDHRIFQHLSVNKIITKILQEQGFGAEGFEFKLSKSYETREYCVQYGETDLHFISRLCEEEGIYFYFEHSENGHKLCFCDREGGPKISGESSLRFYSGSGQTPTTAVINRLELKSQVNSNATTYREWNFAKPRLNLEIERVGDKAPVPPGMLLEQYKYPHLYQLQASGNNYAEVQLLRQLSFQPWIELVSDVSRFLPSFTFDIHEHRRADINAGWWTVAVHHLGEQPGVLEHEAPEGRGQYYQSNVVAIPEMTRFIPPIEHPKNLVSGQQTAIVTGLQGEEVFTDKYSRVKVQFHWDRLGARDENSSCWIRVSAGWAGNGFGFIHIPRIGQEVLVEHLEGDPDRPVITGRAYYAENMPPWQLPEQKTLSGIQSREFKAGRRNQLVMDDTKEEIQTQLSSDHQLSQLNLGYITRIDHTVGRKDFRGEGFELRTDGWGAVRAAKGLYVSTDTRSAAEQHQKDMSEAVSNLQKAAGQHEETTNLAEVHNAQNDGTDGDVTAKALHTQVDHVRGSGQAHGELTEPHIVLSSPAGIALTTPNATHIHTGESTAITAGRHLSVSAGRSFLVSALDRVSLFSHKLGMRLFAARGKMEIQAQSDDLDIIAEKVLQIISAKESVQVTAAKEILMTAGGSYIRINSAGIEEGTKGEWIVHAASRKMTGPASMNPPLPNLPSGAVQFNEQFRVLDEITGEPIADMRYELHFDDGAVISDVTGKDGIIPMQERLDPAKVAVKLLGKIRE